MDASNYCHVVVISMMLFLLVVHKTPPETIVFDPKETKTAEQYGDGNNIYTCAIY